MSEIEKIFATRLRNTVLESSALGYHPGRFEQMLNSSSALSVARKLVTSGDIQYGLEELIKLGRADLAVESIMQEDEFRSLFTAGQLDAASWRLQQAKNQVKDSRKIKP
jgi:hypothetical protein